MKAASILGRKRNFLTRLSESAMIGRLIDWLTANRAFNRTRTGGRSLTERSCARRLTLR